MRSLTLALLTWRILRAPNNASKWQMGFNSEFKGFNDPYSSPDIIQAIKSRRIGWAVHVACMAVSRGVYRVSVCRLERTRPLRNPKRSWDDSIKTDIQEVGRMHGLN
jgi:hypothetical protein